MKRPRGPGLYCEIFLPANNRRSMLKETVRDRDHVPAQLDPRPTTHGVSRELDRHLTPRTFRDVAVDYLELTLTMPEGHS